MQTVKPRAVWSRILQTWKVHFPDAPNRTFCKIGRGPEIVGTLQFAYECRLNDQLGLDSFGRPLKS